MANLNWRKKNPAYAPFSAHLNKTLGLFANRNSESSGLAVAASIQYTISTQYLLYPISRRSGLLAADLARGLGRDCDSGGCSCRRDRRHGRGHEDRDQDGPPSSQAGSVRPAQRRI